MPRSNLSRAMYGSSCVRLDFAAKPGMLLRHIIVTSGGSPPARPLTSCSWTSPLDRTCSALTFGYLAVKSASTFSSCGVNGAPHWCTYRSITGALLGPAACSPGVPPLPHAATNALPTALPISVLLVTISPSMNLGVRGLAPAGPHEVGQVR